MYLYTIYWKILFCYTFFHLLSSYPMFAWMKLLCSNKNAYCTWASVRLKLRLRLRYVQYSMFHFISLQGLRLPTTFHSWRFLYTIRTDINSERFQQILITLILYHQGVKWRRLIVHNSYFYEFRRYQFHTCIE